MTTTDSGDTKNIYLELSTLLYASRVLSHLIFIIISRWEMRSLGKVKDLVQGCKVDEVAAMRLEFKSF